MSNEKTLRQRKGYSPMQYVHIAITLLLMFGFGYLPTFSTLTPVGMKLLGLFCHLKVTEH